MSGRGRRLVLVPTEKRVNVLEAYESRGGIAVRVRENHRNNKVAGMRGTIQDEWVSDAPAGAAEVLLEDGNLRLFWLADLELVDEEKSPSSRSQAIPRSIRGF